MFLDLGLLRSSIVYPSCLLRIKFDQVLLGFVGSLE